MIKYKTIWVYGLLFLATGISLWMVFEVNYMPEKIIKYLNINSVTKQEDISRFFYLPTWLLGLSTALFLVVIAILQIRANSSVKTEIVYLPKYMSKEEQQTHHLQDRFAECPKTISDLFFTIARESEAVCGYLFEKNEDQLSNTESFATDLKSKKFAIGEGLVGQVAKNGQKILVTHVPHGEAFAHSGLGSSPVSSILVLPLPAQDGSVLYVLEFGFFVQPSKELVSDIEKLMSRFTSK